MLIVNLCLGAIWDCKNRFEHKTPSASFGINDPAGVWCADEGKGSCSGPGVVYYGSDLTWTYSDYLADGESISCTNGAFGCDPLFAFKKKCYSYDI